MENKKVNPIELQLGMTIFLLVTDKIDKAYKDKLTHVSPEWVEVKEYLIKKLELEDRTVGNGEVKTFVVLNIGLMGPVNPETGKKAGISLILDHKDVYISQDAAYERARDANNLFKARINDIKTEYTESLDKLTECEIFYEELSKTNLI